MTISQTPGTADNCLATIAALEERLAQLDNAGPRLPDPIMESAYAYLHTCNALSAHYPFHVQAIRRDLRSLEQQLNEKLESLGQAAVPETNRALPAVGRDLAKDGLALVLRKPVPFVVRGGALGCEAIDTWTPQFFAKHYGDYELPLAKGAVQDERGTLAQVVADIESGLPRGHYVHNVADFFNENRDLEDHLPLKEYLSYVEPVHHFGCQLFMGGAKTGTSWHHASGWNFFFNVYGEKRWFMAHPALTPWIYGRMHSSGSLGLTDVDHNKSAEEQLDQFPLYRHVPVYDILLKPGDVLVVPPWWWHAITNISDATVAVSTRWLNPNAADTKPAFRLTQGLMPNFQEFEKEAMLLKDQFRIRDVHVRDTYDNTGMKSDAP